MSVPDHRRTALAVLGVCFVLNMFGRGLGDAYAVFLAPLERDLGWSRSQLTGVFSVYLLVNGFAAPVVGLVFDRVGARWVYATGLASLGTAFFLAGGMSSIWQFYLLAGAMVGLGVSMTGMVPASGLISRWYRERLSRALGIAFSAGGLGVVLFVPLSQYLIDLQDWRFAYRSLGVLLLCLAPIAFFGLPWATYVAGSAAHRDARAKASSDESWTLATAMRTRLYWGLAQAFFFTAAGMYAILVQLVVFLIDAGFPPLTAATAFGITGMLSAASVMGSGFVAERFGVVRTVAVSYAGTVAGMLILIALTLWPLTLLLVLFVPAFGLCLGVRGPIISSICAREFAGPRVATIYGTIYSCNALGAALGAWMGGVLHDLTHGYRVGLCFSLLMIAIAASAFWTVPALRKLR